MVVDGVKAKDYPYVGDPEFSQDGRHIAYSVTDNVSNKSFVVVDGVEGYHYDSLLFSSTFLPTLEERMGFFNSPDKLHYAAWKGKNLYLVEETLK